MLQEQQPSPSEGVSFPTSAVQQPTPVLAGLMAPQAAAPSGVEARTSLLSAMEVGSATVLAFNLRQLGPGDQLGWK